MHFLRGGDALGRDVEGEVSYLDAVKSDLRRDEGCVEHAYTDSQGYLTIGVGRLIDGRIGGKLRPDEIDLMLENDITQAEAVARTLFPAFAGLSDARKAVCVEMAFNLGQTRLAAFQRLREAVSAGAWEQASAEMLDSRWAEQVGARAQRLAKAMKEG